MKKKLHSHYLSKCLEAGCDEAGGGVLAGPVFASAVILPPNFDCPKLNDSKQLSASVRSDLRLVIEEKALAWGVGIANEEEISEHNILNASILAMHRAIKKLKICPEHLIIDGDQFNPYKSIPYTTIVKGDAKYLSIAAASVLAKTHRDDYMKQLHKEYPIYELQENKGYPTQYHRCIVAMLGVSPYHRKGYHLRNIPISEI
ncbi:MAG: ribonuclease HII [Prevotellaceae bacterium]|jgi:ribonuclease HII|nr:ribonuclease HII [Prevotellaceae bacterium]